MTLVGNLTRVRHRAFSGMLATTLLAGTFVVLTSTVASASTAATRGVSASSLTTNGQWAGVGKICESGSGGASSVRGVGPKTINIAVFNDAANTIEPGLEEEFIQFANAFATWCNASGGINGRHIVMDNRDAAFFNSAQVASESCQSDFMAVGGGMVFDDTGYTVSDASAASTLQVNPSNVNPNYDPAGWFAALAKKYPKAVQQAAMSTANNVNDLEPEKKWEDSAEAAGWKIEEFQETPISVVDWTPYVQAFATKGIQAVWPDPSTSPPTSRR
jgi:hypothetical protein